MTIHDLEPENTERMVMDLLKRKNTVEAIAVLQQARSAARSHQETTLAGHFSSLLGSLYLGENLRAEALREYESAEMDEPANVYHKLTTARQLIDAGRPRDALLKLESIAEKLPRNASTIHDYHGLRGEAQVCLDRIDEALREFRLMADPSLVRGLNPLSISLDLVMLLAERGIARHDCLAYLSNVRAKAIARGDAELLVRVANVERLIHNEPL